MILFILTWFIQFIQVMYLHPKIVLFYLFSDSLIYTL